MLYLLFLNRSHARLRESLGKSGVIVDESMLSKSKVRSGKEAAMELEEAGGEAARNGAGVALAQDKGFSDVTDLKNEDFIFVY
jgi:hypothetical protein